jgi:hypothetical protein
VIRDRRRNWSGTRRKGIQRWAWREKWEKERTKEVDRTA